LETEPPHVSARVARSSEPARLRKAALSGGNLETEPPHAMARVAGYPNPLAHGMRLCVQVTWEASAPIGYYAAALSNLLCITSGGRISSTALNRT